MRYFLSVIILSLVFSCNDSDVSEKRTLPNSIGSFSNILVISKKKDWELGLEHTVSTILSKEIEGLIKVEKEFGLTHISAKGFNNMFKKHRSILMIAISKRIKKASLVQRNDVYANGQKYIQVKAPSVESAIALIEKNNRIIFRTFDQHRRSTIQKTVNKKGSKKVRQRLKNYHAVTLKVPSGYKVEVDTTDFIYFYKKGIKNCEYGKNSDCVYHTGFMVYSFPYYSEKIFNSTFLANTRDSLTQLYIEGSSIKDSLKAFMQVESLLPISAKAITLNKAYSYTMKGWWKMQNGIMGGPFVNVSIVDQARNRVICVDGFCFAPNFDKRQFVKELEAICLSVKAIK
jgi:hypothetical protein